MSERRSNIYVIFGAALWGMIGLFTRGLNAAGLEALQITLIRCFVSALLMVVYFLVTDRQKLKIELRDFWYFLGTGICSMVFFNVCYFVTIKELTLSMAAILLYTAPCMIMIMSVIFLGEKMSVQKVAALLVATGGCVLTCVNGEVVHFTLKGILLGLGSGLGYALYSIFGRAALEKYDSLTVTVYTFIVAALCLLFICSPVEIIKRCMNMNALLYALGLSVVSTMLPYILYTKGLEKIPASKASVMAFVEPFVATLIGIVIFKESMTVFNVCGMILIFVSIILLNIPKKS